MIRFQDRPAAGGGGNLHKPRNLTIRKIPRSQVESPAAEVRGKRPAGRRRSGDLGGPRGYVTRKGKQAIDLAFVPVQGSQVLPTRHLCQHRGRLPGWIAAAACNGDRDPLGGGAGSDLV
jgi:hypothetical protein